ncbi:MAG: hypothetical protein KA795_08670 [Burkholderiaceae bacterium]|jgi:hypothetical protein|nr:hypothetical protein [Burkholderiales bacterium]MBP7566067.1 hypothetical protein [Burkholderiaceae bacterium]
MSPWINIAVSYLPDLISLTKPLFTRSKNAAPGPEVVEQQIAELQAAATQNAESIKQLAVDVQKTIDAVQQASVLLERRLARTQLLLAVSLTASALSFVLAAWLLVQR